MVTKQMVYTGFKAAPFRIVADDEHFDVQGAINRGEQRAGHAHRPEAAPLLAERQAERAELQAEILGSRADHVWLDTIASNDDDDLWQEPGSTSRTVLGACLVSAAVVSAALAWAYARMVGG